MPLAVFSHPDCLKHDTGVMHPESAARLEAILSALKECEYAARLRFLEAPLAKREQVLRVHTPSHWRMVEQAVLDDEPVSIDGDTVMSKGSFAAALRAAGAAGAAVDGVMLGEYESAFCAVRPPGHHATPNQAMGFCLFNNVAVAARHAIAAHGLSRVAIVDFDVHHGNGTQAAFETEPKVLYVSTHQWPHYPGTGAPSERGAGNIVNLPLPAGTDGRRYRDVFTRQVLPALDAFRPELLLASAGFDAHKSDPLAALGLTEEDYRWIGRQLRAAAEIHCGGKTVSLLEGGYNLKALAESAVAYLSAFVEA